VVAYAQQALNPTSLARDNGHHNPSPEGLQRTVYLGLGVGRSRLEPDREEISGLDITDGVERGVQATLGLDLNKWLSVEMHAADLGRARLSEGLSIAFRGYGLSALVYVGDDRDRLNRRGWTVFGRTGISYLSTRASDGLPLRYDEWPRWILGAGTEFSLRSGLAFRAEGIAFDTDVSYLQLALVYRIDGSYNGLSRVPGVAWLMSGRHGGRPQQGLIDPLLPADDRDADGIEQDADRCPDTPRGIAVGRDGCALFNGVVEGLTFHIGSASLTNEAVVVLENVAVSLLQIPESKARIAAHTDSLGDAEANRMLSRQRALSVARYLVQRGVPIARLEARAFGESRPVDTNTTADGRRNNRRVEIDLIAE